MINCFDAVKVEIDNLKSLGYQIDKDKYNKFKEVCDNITLMRGIELESIVVHINDDCSISIKLGTYYVEIEDAHDNLFDILSDAIEFSFWVAGKGTPDAMLVIDIKFEGFWNDGDA